MSIDKQVIIIGGGPSGLGFAIQLIRQYDFRDFILLERLDKFGGTWYQNSYPGCGCDVPSHFYSFSFALNPNWSHKYSSQPEILEYFQDLAEQYSLQYHARFRTAVTDARWDAVSGTWIVQTYDQTTLESTTLRCKILISAVGGLSMPKDCDIPGAADFAGRFFHSANWDHTFDYAGKDVICIGNGCSATQFVPVMSDGPKKVNKITQFSRQAHWLSERPNPSYSTTFQRFMKWTPGLMRIYRFWLYALQEKDFAGFDIKSGERLRGEWTDETTQYIKRNSPERYADMLVPKTVIGCKRRVMDTHYLACLHRENVELITDDPISRITEVGIETESGRVVKADAIVLANGFQTQKPLFPMDIRGIGGASIQDHWNEFGDGAPEAYFGTCLSGFPNFFIMMGPNTLSGHLSVLYTSECQINYTLRVIRPILQMHQKSLLSTIFPRQLIDVVSVKSKAERADIAWADKTAKSLVWASGCASWFLHEKTGRNTIMFPAFQYKFWWRSVFINWDDLSYGTSQSVEQKVTPASSMVTAALAIVIVAVGSGVTILRRQGRL